MGLLAWVMLGLAIWHYTIFLPDRFWGGIVGALIGSLLGSIISGFLIYGIKVSAFAIPGEKTTDVAVVLYAVPGALLGIAAVYALGVHARRRRRQTVADFLAARRPPVAVRAAWTTRAVRLEVPPCPPEQVLALREQLAISDVLAQIARAPRACRADRRARLPGRPRALRARATSTASRTPSSWSSTTSERAGGSPSTATTTPTASARPPSSSRAAPPRRRRRLLHPRPRRTATGWQATRCERWPRAAPR